MKLTKSEKSYADYLAERTVITTHLAPAGAVPKFTKGDSPKYHFQKTNPNMIRRHKRGVVAVIKQNGKRARIIHGV